MKQTLIKIADDHYIVVDDSEIKKGDWVVGCTKTVVQCMYPENVHHRDVKKITHSTQPLELLSENGLSGMGFSKVRPLNVFEVKELLGVVDVEKSMWYERNLQNPYPSDSPSNTGFNKGFELGYNQALEDNKDRKYTREDLLDAYTWGFLEGTERGDDVTDSVNKFSQSLQPKTEWNVEFVDGKLKLVQQ